MGNQIIGTMRQMRGVSRIGQFVRIYSAIVTGGIVVASALIAVMAGLILCTTGMRYLADKPQLWTEQLNGIFLITVTLIALAHCLRKGIHVRVDLVVSHLPARLRDIAEVVVAVAGLTFTSLLIWKGWNLAWLSYVQGYHGASPPGYPLFPSQVMVPIGFFLLAMAFLEQAAKTMVKVRRGR